MFYSVHREQGEASRENKQDAETRAPLLKEKPVGELPESRAMEILKLSPGLPLAQCEGTIRPSCSLTTKYPFQFQ